LAAPRAPVCSPIRCATASAFPIRLNFYTEEELEKIVTRGARVLNIGMSPDAPTDRAPRPRHAAHRRPPAAPGPGILPPLRTPARRPQHRRITR